MEDAEVAEIKASCRCPSSAKSTAAPLRNHFFAPDVFRWQAARIPGMQVVSVILYGSVGGSALKRPLAMLESAGTWGCPSRVISTFRHFHSRTEAVF